MLDVGPLLMRNLDLEQLPTGAARVIDDDPTVRSNATSTGQLLVGQGEASTDVLDEIRTLLATALLNLRFDEVLLDWVIAPLVDQSRAAEATAWFGRWRFTGQVLKNDPPHPENPEAWFIVEAEDVVLDILLQPLRALMILIKMILENWLAVQKLGIRTLPNLSAPDETVAALEMFLIRALKMNSAPAPGGSLHYRYNATTVGQLGRDSLLPLTLGKRIDFHIIEEGTDFPWERNVSHILNESCQPLIGASEALDSKLLVDPYYGLPFSASVLQHNEGVYLGPTNPLPPPVELPGLRIDLDPSPNHGRLTVPFRQVPRYRVNSAGELRDLLLHVRAQYDASFEGTPDQPPLLFRGQTREYLLSRNGDTAKALYGEGSILEPALLPSATRRTTATATYEAFAAVVAMYLQTRTATPRGGWDSLFSQPLGDAIKLAFAQHYGLATSGLDWTSDFTIAMWFATTRLISSGQGILTTSTVEPDDEVVIYCLRPEQRHVVNLNRIGIEAVRPLRQAGWISITGWGWRQNAVSQYLMCAIYFPGSIRKQLLSSMPSTDQLFPGRADDPLVAISENLSASSPNSSISSELANSLYVVTSGI